MTKRLHKPREPAPGECCGSGCARCVWDVYYDKLAAYEAEKKKLEEQKQNEEEECESRRESSGEEYSESDSFDSDENDMHSSSISSIDDEAVCDYTGSVIIKFVEAPDGKTESMVEEEIRQSDLLKEFMAVHSFRLKRYSACSDKSFFQTAPVDWHHHQHHQMKTAQDVDLSFPLNNPSNNEDTKLNEDGYVEERNRGGIFVTELELSVEGNVLTPTFMPGDVIEVFVPNHMSSSVTCSNNTVKSYNEIEDDEWNSINELCSLMQVSPTAWCELRRSPFVPESHFPPWLPERFVMTVRLLMTYYVDISSGGYLLRPNFLQNLWRVYELQKHGHCNIDTNKTTTALQHSSEEHEENELTQNEKTHLINLYEEEEEQLSPLEENATPFLLGALVTCKQQRELSRILNKTHHPLCYPQLADMLRVFKFVSLPLARLCELSGPIRPRKFSVVSEKLSRNKCDCQLSSTSDTCIVDNRSKNNKCESNCVVELCVRETCAAIPSLPRIETLQEQQQQKEVYENKKNKTTIEETADNNNSYDTNERTLSVESLAYTLARILNNAALVRSREREHVKQRFCTIEQNQKIYRTECTNFEKNTNLINEADGSYNNGEMKLNGLECPLRTSISNTPIIFHGHVSHPLCRLSFANTHMSQDLFHEKHNKITTFKKMKNTQTSVPSELLSETELEYKENLINSSLLLLTPCMYITRRLYNTSIFAQQLHKAVQALVCYPLCPVQFIPKLFLIGAGTGIAPMMAAVNTLLESHTQSIHSLVQENKFEQESCNGRLFNDSRHSSNNSATETINKNGNNDNKNESNNSYEITHISKEHPHPCWVFYGARTREELVYHEELTHALSTGMIAKYEWVTSRTSAEYVDVNSVAINNRSYNGKEVVEESPLRYVTELMTKYADVIRTSLLEEDGQMFICGPTSMLRSCRELLLHSHVLVEDNDMSNNEDDESVTDQRLRFLESRHQINYDVWSSVNIFE